MLPGGGTAGSALAGPSWACSELYCAGVRGAPAGFSGPITCVKSPLARSLLVAVASGTGFCHTGSLNWKITLVGFAAACGKCFVSRACPAAESLPAGGETLPPNPAAV